MPAIFIPAVTTSHPDVVPYVSIEDYANAPTAVDATALIPGANAQANLVELANVIRRASGWANSLCFQTLAATLDTQSKYPVRVRSDGTVRVVCDFWPVLELDSFSVGPTPSTMTAVTQAIDIFLAGRSVLVIPVYGLSGTTTQLSYPGPLRPGSRAFCQWTYWNGWPHSKLQATAAAGTSSLPLTTILPASTAGRVLTIWDGANTEQVTVASSFAGGTALTLASPTVFLHTLPAAPGAILVTALPDDVRQAIISLTSALIKTRGAESYEMPAVGQEPTKGAEIEGGGMEDVSVACDLLSQYRRVAY